MDQEPQQQQSTFDQGQEQAEQILNNVTENQQPVHTDPTFPIIITVSDPMVKDSGFSKHTVYNIKGSDRLGAFDVFRRYTDFYELREVLIKKWPGCYVPPIPEKMLASGNDQEVVQLRRRLLNIFLQILSNLEHIYYSEDVSQTFLRASGDVSKIFTAIKPSTTLEIIERIKQAFPNIEFRDQNNAEYMLTISTFQGQLRKAQTYLKGYIEQAQIVAWSRKQLQDGKMLLYQQLLPHYERMNQIEYVGGIESKLILANPANSGQLKQLLDTMNDNYRHNNPIDNITDLFRFEYKDSESMQQCLNYRDYLISLRSKVEQRVREDQAELAKISAGKQTITTITNSVFNKSKDQAQVKVEQKISEGQLEIERIQELTNMITSLIATKEINQYRSNRVKFYHKMLLKTQQQEKQMYEPENQLLTMLKEQAQSQQ